MEIRTELVLLVVLAVAGPGLIIGYTAYGTVNDVVDHSVQERLMDRATDWRILLEAYEQNIRTQELDAKVLAKGIITEQAKYVYELIDLTLDEHNDTLPDDAREDVLGRLARHTVGRTGYVWILDYDGNYVLSKRRERDGENIWESMDSDGNLVIQDLVGIGRTLGDGDIGYHSYPWLNLGETVPRDKLAAMLHFPGPGWVVGVSAYYDDVVDMDYRRRVQEDVKDLIARQVIGRSGYIAIISKDGKYIVSKDRVRDGEDISMSQDTTGNHFIQEGVRKARDAGHGVDFITYPWTNPGEKESRQKVAAVTWFEDWEWVVWVSAYYDDFNTADTLMYGIAAMVVLSVLVAGFTSYELGKQVMDVNEASRMARMARRGAYGGGYGGDKSPKKKD